MPPVLGFFCKRRRYELPPTEFSFLGRHRWMDWGAAKFVRLTVPAPEPSGGSPRCSPLAAYGGVFVPLDRKTFAVALAVQKPVCALGLPVLGICRGLAAKTLRSQQDEFLLGLTFELSGRRRQDARPGLAKMYRVPPDRAWWPAVGAPLERGVRQRCAR